MRRAARSPGIALLASVVLALSLPLRGGSSEVHSGDRYAFALTGARVIAAPGRVIENGIVVVRGGVIESVGPPGTAAVRGLPDFRFPIYDCRLL